MNHVITFLSRLKKFTAQHGITSILMVDKNNTVEDVFNTSETTGGLIADIDNDIGEIIDALQDYYEKTKNKKLLNRLNKIK